MHLLTKDHVYEKIQERILSGAIPKGSRLAENVLAKELGVSRTPVREALSRLVHEGIAEHVPNDGVFLRRPTLKDIEDIYDLRIVLECHAAYRAAQYALPIHLQQMEDALRRCDEALLQGNEYRTFDERWGYIVLQFEFPFHTAIFDAADNVALTTVAASTQMLMKTIHYIPNDGVGVSDDSVREEIDLHERIYRSIKNGDSEAAVQAMREHTGGGLQDVIRRFELAQRLERAQNVQRLI